MNTKDDTLAVTEIRSDEYVELQQEALGVDIKQLQANLNNFVSVVCPACSGVNSEFAFEKYQFKFSTCLNCLTLYMSPRPTPAIMSEYYQNSENYKIWKKYIFPTSENVRREKICLPNLEIIKALCLENALHSPSLLEIGPGFGTFAELAQSSGQFSDVLVVERATEMIEACRRRGLKVVDQALEDIEDSGITADIAVCFEVIEHVYNPDSFLRLVAKILNPKGFFIFTCPNGNGFDTKILGKLSPAVDHEHVNLFNPKSIQILLNRAGFDVLNVETHGKMDVDIIRRAAESGEFIPDERSFLACLLNQKNEQVLESFQKFISSSGLSGSMRITARKR